MLHREAARGLSAPSGIGPALAIVLHAEDG